jgi:hypothetical protein
VHAEFTIDPEEEHGDPEANGDRGNCAENTGVSHGAMLLVLEYL